MGHSGRVNESEREGIKEEVEGSKEIRVKKLE